MSIAKHRITQAIQVAFSILPALSLGANISHADEFYQFEMVNQDGNTRPFVVYEPDNHKNRPLLVYLHGAISSPTLKKDPLDYAKKSAIIDLAKQGNFYVLFAYGQKGATWFDDVGVSMVIDEVAWAKKRFDIDDSKVFLGGFSDGGSGTFYIASTKGDDFAGFIALNGSLPVAVNLGKSPVYPSNINQKGVYVVNTQSDMLYPAKMMIPTIKLLEASAPNTTFVMPNGNHDPSYLPSLKDDILDFMDKNTDQTHTSISLEASDLPSQFDWLSIESLDLAQPPQAWHTPYSLIMHNNKARFGMIADPNYQGEGIKVAGFANDDASAKKMGVQVGDVILKMQDVVLDHPYASFEYLSGKKAGESTTLTIQRDGQTQILTGKFNDGYTYEVFGKQKPSGKVQASFENNTFTINTSRISSFAIDFNQLTHLIAPNTPIKVIINGVSVTTTAHDKQLFVVPFQSPQQSSQ